MNRYILVALLLLGGCASSKSDTLQSYSDIRQAAQHVNLEDGMSENEAKIIAQNFLILEGYYDRLHSIKPYRIQKDVYFYRNGVRIEIAGTPSPTLKYPIHRVWTLQFKDRKKTIVGYPYIGFFVQVDGNTGDVIDWGLENKIEQMN